MKRNLLALFFSFFALLATAQSSFFDSDSDNYLAAATPIEINIFPNPVVNFIGITDNSTVQTVMIYNLVGRKLKTFHAVRGEKYYLGDLPRGMYLVQLLDESKKVIKTQRINKN